LIQRRLKKLQYFVLAAGAKKKSLEYSLLGIGFKKSFPTAKKTITQMRYFLTVVGAKFFLARKESFQERGKGLFPLVLLENCERGAKMRIMTTHANGKAIAEIQDRFVLFLENLSKVTCT
jgi:hypothetical protein